MIIGLALELLNAKLPFLSPVFGEHMVLQRDKLNTFWGWTQPGETVTISISGKSVTTKATEDGKWKAQIMPPKVGGPYTLKIQGSQSVEFKDILVGDIWLCSGQSNMEMGVSAIQNGTQEVAQANHPMIRLYTVGKAAPSEPLQVPVGQWRVCNPSNVAQDGWGGFSAVGYFFGRYLQKKLNVPIGLINSSWGGSTAEAWTSPAGLATISDFKAELEQTRQRKLPGAKSTAEAMAEWCAKNKAGDFQGVDVDTTGWKAHEGPATLGEIGLQQAQSVIWFRREFEVPANRPVASANLVTASVDGYADVWLNGVYVGSQASVLNWGYYPLKEGILKPGKNVLAVRTIGQRWGGGFTNGKDSSGLWLSDGKFLNIRGTWHAKETVKLANAPKLPPVIDGNPFWPSAIGNAMIQPLAPLSIKGAIWYQGESNVGRAEQYQRLLPAMINDWRKSFGQGDFPCYVVQLANFGGRNANPVDDEWAKLREAQAIGTTKTKNSGYVVTHDIGDAQDIHPLNKQDVGKRLALLALNKTYGKKTIYAAPTLSKMTAVGNELHLEFKTEGALIVKDAKPHHGFAIASENGQYQWATVKVVGKKIILSSEKVRNPIHVRYAWDADPVVTLFNDAGLPTGPFQAIVKR